MTLLRQNGCSVVHKCIININVVIKQIITDFQFYRFFNLQTFLNIYNYVNGEILIETFTKNIQN